MFIRQSVYPRKSNDAFFVETQNEIVLIRKGQTDRYLTVSQKLKETLNLFR